MFTTFSNVGLERHLPPKWYNFDHFHQKWPILTMPFNMTELKYYSKITHEEDNNVKKLCIIWFAKLYVSEIFKGGKLVNSGKLMIAKNYVHGTSCSPKWTHAHFILIQIFLDEPISLADCLYREYYKFFCKLIFVTSQ